MAKVAQTAAPKSPLIIIFGATGTGKSQLAVDIAQRFNGEIINGDAMQLYAGLPIVTNKITMEEQGGIPHHFLGCIPFEDATWRVGIWRREALRVIEGIRDRGKVPVVVGGTHYYLQSLLGGDAKLLDSQAVRNEEGLEGEWDGTVEEKKEMSREEIEARWPVLKESGEMMLEELKRIDPVMAERWHPNDRRKIQRSLQIWLMTGRKASEVYAEQKASLGIEKEDSDVDHDGISDVASEMLLFWVHAENQTLKSRLDARVDKMLQAGLLDEVKSLNTFLQAQEASGHPVDSTRGIWVSIGWKEFEPYLSAINSRTATESEISSALQESIERTQGATRRYAKYQVRWIRHQILPVTAKGVHKLFLLDSSDLPRFEEDVSKKAIEITSSWLEGKALPEPTKLSDLAKEFLEVEEKVDSLSKRTCDVCGVVTVTDVQWKTHLQSRKHRGTLKKRAKNKGLEAFSNKREATPGQEDLVTP